jgi:hypothetical protein
VSRDQLLILLVAGVVLNLGLLTAAAAIHLRRENEDVALGSRTPAPNPPTTTGPGRPQPAPAVAATRTAIAPPLDGPSVGRPRRRTAAAARIDGEPTPVTRQVTVARRAVPRAPAGATAAPAATRPTAEPHPDPTPVLRPTASVVVPGPARRREPAASVAVAADAPAAPPTRGGAAATGSPAEPAATPAPAEQPKGAKRRSSRPRRFTLPDNDDDHDRIKRSIAAFLGEPVAPVAPGRQHRRRHRARRPAGAAAPHTDVVLAIAGSGRSPRVAHAVAAALRDAIREVDEIVELPGGRIRVRLESDDAGSSAFVDRAQTVVRPWLDVLGTDLELRVVDQDEAERETSAAAG